MSVESAIANYQAGKVPFVAVLEALTTLYEDRVALTRAPGPPRAAAREPRGGEPRAAPRASRRRPPPMAWSTASSRHGRLDAGLRGRRCRSDFTVLVVVVAGLALGGGPRPAAAEARPPRPRSPARPLPLPDAPDVTCPTSPATARSAAWTWCKVEPSAAAAPRGGRRPPRESPGAPASRLGAERRQVLGVRSEEIHHARLERAIRTVGRVAVDERRLHHVHTKFEGYVEHLYVDFTGKLREAGRAAAVHLQPRAGGDAAGVPARPTRAQERLARAPVPSVARGGARPAGGGAPAAAAVGHPDRGHRHASSGPARSRARSTCTPTVSGYVVQKNGVPRHAGDARGHPLRHRRPLAALGAGRRLRVRPARGPGRA